MKNDNFMLTKKMVKIPKILYIFYSNVHYHQKYENFQFAKLFPQNESQLF
jgi:hypothetical protein